MIGDAEGVVAGRGGDNATFLLLRGKQQQRVARPAFFEAAGALEIFQFAKNLHASGFRERDGERARGFDNEAADAFCSGLDIVELNWHLDSKARPFGGVNRGSIKDAER